MNEIKTLVPLFVLHSKARVFVTNFSKRLHFVHLNYDLHNGSDGVQWLLGRDWKCV